MKTSNTNLVTKASTINPQLIESELRVLDTDLAKRLGFANPRMIRRLIKRHLPALDQLGTRSTVERVIKGGEATEYYLNKKQAIFITAKSETPEATEITLEVIERFDAYETGKITIKAPRKRKQPMDIAFKQFKNIAALIGGLDETQQIIAADRGVYSLLGRSPLSEMGMSSLPAPTNDAYLTPTELGKKMGDLPARKVNTMLADKGLQVRTPGSASGSPWAMTKAGEPYGRMHDTSRRNGTGSQQQLKWKPTVLDLISGKGEAA